MYTKNDLTRQLARFDIADTDTVFIHSSLKSVGEVEGRAEGLLEAICGYYSRGLVVLPSHTWSNVNEQHPICDIRETESCVGALTNVFRKMEGVRRSYHPTHSVCAYGRDAEAYVSGEEQSRTPCARAGCYGKLLDRDAVILFLGISIKTNTFLHGVEEWNNIPLRLEDKLSPLFVRTETGKLLETPQYRHFCPMGEVSQHYIKMKEPFEAAGILKTARLGDAECYYAHCGDMYRIVSAYLQKKPQLFADGDPVPASWYR